MNTTFTKIITIRDIYGTDTPEIPKGYKAVDFRYPKQGEMYLWSIGTAMKAGDDHHEKCGSPLIILSKLPDPVVVKGNVEYEAPVSTVTKIYFSDVTIPEGYEFVDFRPPANGETFISCLVDRVLCYADYSWNPQNTGNARIIVRKVTTT